MITNSILSSISMVTPSQAIPTDSQPIESSPTLTAMTPETEAVPSSEPRGYGVLQKLLSGHFRGVSELRLRINFHEELTAARNEIAREAATAASGTLLEAVGAEFSSAADTLSLTEDQLGKMENLQSTFDQGVGELVESHLAGEGGVDSDLAAEIEATFENLVANLEQLAGGSSQPDDTLEPTLTAVGDVVSEPIAPEFQAFLSALRETFSANLAELSLVLEQEPWQPSPSAPHGQGRAYEKFLAAYEALQTPVEEAPVAGDGKNVTVNFEAIDILA